MPVFVFPWLLCDHIAWAIRTYSWYPSLVTRGLRRRLKLDATVGCRAYPAVLPSIFYGVYSPRWLWVFYKPFEFSKGSISFLIFLASSFFGCPSDVDVPPFLILRFCFHSSGSLFSGHPGEYPTIRSVTTSIVVFFFPILLGDRGNSPSGLAWLPQSSRPTSTHGSFPSGFLFVHCHTTGWAPLHRVSFPLVHVFRFYSFSTTRMLFGFYRLTPSNHPRSFS